MKINDKVVVHARSGKVKTGEREVQISKNASRYEPVYSDVGGSASGSWSIPAGQGDVRVEITFRYEADVLFTWVVQYFMIRVKFGSMTRFCFT
ncbi:Host specificity protein J from prophage [Escherichia coli]|uniref:Host specificity protein J from prophage n=1 Tax=Escherichia coli TaxID=562 RepID=A0A376W7W7_ECOLX|nr:Host specificity protein J from prophage [Escherichia coli]